MGQQGFSAKCFGLAGAFPLIAILFLATTAPAEELCGNFLCACGSGENAEACPTDCGDCGDLICDPYESSDSCPLDCGPCGDLICDGAETHDTCPGDCPELCGDLICDSGELDCPIDCDEAIVACEVPAEPSPSPSFSPSPSPIPDDGDDDPLDGAKFGGGGGCSLNVRIGD